MRPNEGAAKALELIYRSGERFRELGVPLERRKDLAVEPSERKDLLFQICDLEEGVLKDEGRSPRLRRDLELEPASVRLQSPWNACGRRRWRDLDELLARAVPCRFGCRARPAAFAAVTARRTPR